MSKVVTIAAVVMLSIVPARSQTVLGTLTGHVTDDTGASVTGAAVTATNSGTNLVYLTTTNQAGNYVLQQLPVASYDLVVEAVGFRRYLRRGIELSVAQTLTIDANLEVGQIEQAVEVTADVGTLQTSTSDLGTTIQRTNWSIFRSLWEAISGTWSSLFSSRQV